ncbi:hypothetical protein, partial [Kaarinaea lacus]
MIHFNCKPGLSRILIVIVFYTFSNYAVANDEDLENFGDAMQYVLPLTAWGATFIYDDKDGRIQFYKHGITAFSITTVGKWVFDKTRPNASSSTT